jgi:hypothetical protein
MNVTETASPTRTVSARAGPKMRKNSSWATSSEAVPAVTIRPAARMIGVNSAVVARVASSRLSPSSRRWRSPERKKIE